MTDHPAAIAERERIVAWLRTFDPLRIDSIDTVMMTFGGFSHPFKIADAIERRDHVPDASKMVGHITQSGGRGDE